MNSKLWKVIQLDHQRRGKNANKVQIKSKYDHLGKKGLHSSCYLDQCPLEQAPIRPWQDQQTNQSHNSTWSDWNPIDESLLFLWMYLWWINYLPRSLKFFLHHKWVLRWLMLILLDGVTAKRRLSSESGSMDSLEKGFFVSTLLSFQAWKSGWSGVGRSHGNSIHHHQRRGEKERDIENK